MHPPGPALRERPRRACSPAVHARDCCVTLVCGLSSRPSGAMGRPGYHAWAWGLRGEAAAGSHAGASGLSSFVGWACRIGGWSARRIALRHCCLCFLAIPLASRSPLRTGGRRRRRRTRLAGAALVKGPRGVGTSRTRLALAGRPGLIRRGEVWVVLPRSATCRLLLWEPLPSTLWPGAR